MRTVMADDTMNKSSERLAALRAAALRERDPTASDDVLAVLLDEAARIGGARVLEVGTGRGLTAIALLLGGAVHVTAVERDGERIAAAKENFASFGVADRVRLLEGDALDLLPQLEERYDLIFLDCAKVQYRRLLPDCRRLLRAGGVLCADDVSLFSGDVPKKRRMLARHIEEFLQALSSDDGFRTQVLSVGKGLAVARRTEET